MILQGAMVQAREDANTNEAPIREIDGRECTDILSLESTDAVDAVSNCRIMSVRVRNELGGEGKLAIS